MPPHQHLAAESKINALPLADLFAKKDGGRVRSPEEWAAQSSYWLEQVVNLEYGGMPPAPEHVVIESRCHARIRRWDDGSRLNSYSVRCHGGEWPIALGVKIYAPAGEGLFPTILYGDGCWHYLSDDMIRSVLGRGMALAVFDRTEMAEDLVYPDVVDKQKRSGGLYDVYPGKGFGAIAAWAWAYHRAVDLLTELSYIDASKIAISGHSRGGKTTLLAGATDPRIALVHDNASGAGGSASFRYVGPGGETLNIVRDLYSWFGRGLDEYIGEPERLPFDQHCLLAAIAPRPLLHTYALDDHWSNQRGMVQCSRAVKQVYGFLDAAEDHAFHLREGGHFYAPEDLARLLEFIDWRWFGREPESAFNTHPYGDLPEPFSWRAPKVDS
ncbi:alpha/beta hydrolase family protein [Cerasicoccus fimbriatus]|uniref:alpha/beta hydrolase family protein n=1 Tax=Cerasicoccus fimbriatus TaxID=3014554 RepID=UPI0022B50841|nr:hypothetical protein [Cerasicoccus sp. TK19100]